MTSNPSFVLGYDEFQLKKGQETPFIWNQGSLPMAMLGSPARLVLVKHTRLDAFCRHMQLTRIHKYLSLTITVTLMYLAPQRFSSANQPGMATIHLLLTLTHTTVV